MFISHHCSKATNYFNTHQIGGSCHRALASSNHILARKDSPKKEVQVNDFSLNKHTLDKLQEVICKVRTCEDTL